MHPPVTRACSLREEEHGLSVARALGGALEALDRARARLAVDRDHPGGPETPAEHGNEEEEALGDDAERSGKRDDDREQIEMAEMVRDQEERMTGRQHPGSAVLDRHARGGADPARPEPSQTDDPVALRIEDAQDGRGQPQHDRQNDDRDDREGAS